MMKASEKIKAQKVIDKIQSGIFDENDIDNLFMRLRAYSAGHRIFREAADLVAHNDARDRGLLSESLENMHLSFRYFLEYAMPDVPGLDVSKPIPIYIKKLMKYQVGKCKPEYLREKFNITPERLNSRIDTYFKDDRKSQTTQLQLFKLGKDGFAPFEYLVSFIASFPAFSGDQLLNDLLAVLRLNALRFDEIALVAQKPTILICMMLLMHESQFALANGATGECRVAIEKTVMDQDAPSGQAGKQVELIQVLGTISLNRPDGSPMKVAYPIFQSGLRAADYCDASLFNGDMNSESPETNDPRFNLNGNLLLSVHGKLGRA